MTTFKAWVIRSAHQGTFVWTIKAHSEEEAREQAKEFIDEMGSLYIPESLVVWRVSE